MPLNFPDNPVDNQVYSPTPQKAWVYNASQGTWLASNVSSQGTKVTVQDAAPQDSDQGDLWFNSETGSLNVNYDDTTSEQWVNISSSGIIESEDVINDNTMLTASESTLATSSSIKAYVDDIVGADVENYRSEYVGDFITITAPNNAADTNGYGSVDYLYRIAKYQVSKEDILAFNNDNTLDIGFRNFYPGNDHPATDMSWNECARYVNWLNIREGHQPAYQFTTNLINDDIVLWSSADAWQLGGENLYRHKDAKYFIPSEDEWYKAGLYSLAQGVYLPNPEGLNVQSDASDNLPGTAVFDASSGPVDVQLAGGPGPFGTIGQGGNAYELVETAFSGVNNDAAAARTVIGRTFSSNGSVNVNESRRWMPTTLNSGFNGLRVAARY